MTCLSQRTKESATNELRFVYDGWNLIATLSSQLSTLNSFVWGLDLSGSFQGAGGIGGLLWVNNGSASTHFVSYDGNGNVSALVSAADGSESARYEYGPFGEVIRASGPAVGSMVSVNPFRFSTKYQDDETDLLYYGYRYYTSSVGRWLSRDPLTDASFLSTQVRLRPTQLRNLFRQSLSPEYVFVSNEPSGRIDGLGLDVYRVTSTSLCSTPLHRKIIGDYPGNLSVDSALAAEAAQMGPGDFGPYIFLWNDCGTFANSWLRGTRRSVINARASWPGIPVL